MKRRFNRLNSAVAAAVCAALFLLAGTRICAAASQVLQGHVPRAVSHFGLKPVGHFDSTNRMRLAIGLPLRDKEGLTNLLQQIYDPASPNYHHYLTVPEFAARFGPAPADYQTLVVFAVSHKLNVLGTHPNRVLLDVEGSVADIEKAFHVTMQNYRHPTEQRDFFAPDTEPSIDLDLPVLHVSGLDNYVVPHPLCHRLTKGEGLSGTNNAPMNGSGPGGAYLGYDFRTAYAPGVTLTGTGQNCALLEFDGYFPSDIVSYEAQAGLPSPTLVNIAIDGGIVGTPGGGVGEVSLDIEMVIAMAPGISTLFVYEAPNGSPVDDLLSRMASDNSSKQISSSWGFQTDATSEQLFQQFAAQGQSFYQASGDSDAYVGPISTPEDDPNITLVGGTTLTMTGTGASYSSEKVWNWGYQPPGGAPQFNNYWGSGGGISTTYSIPTWQQGVSMTNNNGSTTFRNTPDVALTADNIWVIAGDQTQDGAYGGTSCAAPLWNGFTALVNQQAANNGEAPQGFINPAVYTIGKSGNYVSCFHDIVTGDNTWSNSPNNFFAVPGYDLATGWGTPTGSNLINALAPISHKPVLAVVTNFISGGNGNGVIDFDECNSLTIILTNMGSVAATGIQATLTSSTVGAIVAQGTSTYPAIFPHNSAPNLSAFTISTEPSFVCGTPINLTMVVKCDQVTQTNQIQLSTGVLGSPDSFTNATPISIPNTNPVPVNSPIFVSGLQSVGKITVSVYLAAAYDAGLSLNLISPSGTNVLLSQFNGGLGANYGSACSSNSETIFDDAALIPITAGAPPFIGTFAPQQPLSVFKLATGTNVNGVWNLQVMDEFPGDPATLGCWSLNILPEVCVDGGGQCPGADLSLVMSANPNPVFVGSNLNFTLTVSNAGPGTADNVVISQTLPTNIGFVQITGYPATPTLSGTNLNLLMGSLPVYGTATVTVVTLPASPGLITSTAFVGSQDTDANLNNNSASASVFISEPTADVAVRMVGSPASVLQGGLLTYTISVTNNGPFAAKSVMLSTVLPATANFVSATASQGTVSFNGTVESLGDIGMGTNVVVTIVVSPTITGNITASTIATISPLQMDPNTFNNTASVTTTVGPAADLAVTAVATPSPVVAGNNVTYTMVVTNLGPNTATAIAFTQTVPSGSAPVSCSLPGSTLAANAITATIASLASGASLTVTDVLTSPTLLPGVQSQPIISTISVLGQPGDPNTNNNVVTLQTIAEPAQVTITSAGATVTAGSSNGSIGPTGRYTVQFYLENTGTVSTTNLVATLLNSNGVTLVSGSQIYGALQPINGTLPPVTPTGRAFSFTANSTNGGAINAVLQLQDGTNNLGFVTNAFVMPVVMAFWNTNFISIPTQTAIPEPDSGPANPYPSSIVVSNVTGDVGSVTVTVSNLFHTYPNDIGVLLVGPTGASCVLMSAVARYSTMTNIGATVTFDQNAALVLPSSGQIVAGTYQPADYFAQQYPTLTETYSNSPVPSGPYNTNLAVFGTIAANGTWRLYIEDNAPGDAGAISNGWGLTITTITPVNQVADLTASIVASTNQVVLGNNITNIWSVTNNGPNAANAFVTNILSAGLSYVTNVLPPGATIVQSGATTNIFNLGNLVAGSGVSVTNVVSTSATGAQTNSITTGSIVQDGNPGNNSASVVVTVNPPPADLSVMPISAAPNPVVIGSNVVFTVVVLNNGPSNAFNVVGWFTNAANLQVVSVNSSQGTYVTNAGYVQFNLGPLANGNVAVATVTATAASVGTGTNYWTVANAPNTCVDTNLSNNSTNIQVTVTQPRAIITNGPVVLVSQASPPYNGAINSNQTVTLSFALNNIGSGKTTNLVATLQSNAGVKPLTTNMLYGQILPGGSASNQFQFVGSGKPGAIIAATLALQDGSNTNLGTVSYNFMIPTNQTFANSGAIVIPDVGPASPYPSVIQVSSMTNGASDLLVSQATVTLSNFTHSFPHDVEAVLVSPAGQEVVLMEHTGGPFTVSNLVFTFNDTNSQMLPTNTLFSGGFLSTEYAPFDIFPGLSEVPAGSTNLAFLNGMDVNGVWSLYVYDDSAGNNGIIANGWSLNLTAVSPINPAARLLVTTIEAPNPAIGGDYVNYQVTVQNLGPGTANNVVLTDVTPSGTALSQTPVSQTQGTSSVLGGTVTCNLGTITVGQSVFVTLQIIAGARGTIVNTATATTTSADLYPPDAVSVTKTPVGGNQAPFLSAVSQSGGTVQLTVDGYLGQSYAVQISSNLVNWITISTNTGAFSIIDNSTNAPARFYRAVQLPQ